MEFDKIQKQLRAIIPHPDAVDEFEEAVHATENGPSTSLPIDESKLQTFTTQTPRRIIDDTRFEKLFDVLKVCDCQKKRV
jgi:hypothetical protein